MLQTCHVFHHSRQTSTTGGGVQLAEEYNWRRSITCHHSFKLSCKKGVYPKVNSKLIFASVHLKSYSTFYPGAFCRLHLCISLSDEQCMNEVDLSIYRLQTNCHTILAGDFNHPDFDWSKKFANPRSRYLAVSSQSMNSTQDNNPHQVITSPIIVNNILELEFENVQFIVQNVNILPCGP